MTPPRSSVKDVAALAAVSVGTVSNVLNRPEIVADATRQRVEAAIAELQFHRNASARHLRAGVSHTVGAIVQDVSNPFYTELVRGIEDRLAADDHTLILCSSDADPAREQRYLRMLIEHDVRGVLIAPTVSTIERITNFAKLGIPAVLMDADLPDVASVSVDNVHGGHQAIEHLLERGHRRIAVLADNAGIQSSDQRCLGARQAVLEAGLDPHDVLQIVHLPSRDANAGQRAIAALLDSDRPPTAAFTINDIVALGVLRESRRRDMLVPEQLAVVGYDDTFLAAELMVPLSSVRQPMWELGWAAADLLLTGTPHSPFIPELIVRASSSCQCSSLITPNELPPAKAVPRGA